MQWLRYAIPNADDLLALPAEDLGAILLKIAAGRMQQSGFTYEGVTEITVGYDMAAYRDSGYPPHKKSQIDACLARGWNWLERSNLIEPLPGTNGGNGWWVFTEEGWAIANGKDPAQVRATMDFPETLLLPAIREKVWAALERGDFDEAVFAAFKAVEEAVRRAGGFGATDIGVAGVSKTIETEGAEPRYLPPYSPDLNPIENTLGKLRVCVRKATSRTFDALEDAAAHALSRFSTNERTNFFAHAGYGFNYGESALVFTAPAHPSR